MVNDLDSYALRDKAEAAADRIRAYLARFPNMKSVGPETTFDLRGGVGNPCALPVTDLRTVLDRLREAEVGRERFEGEASELRVSWKAKHEAWQEARADAQRRQERLDAVEPAREAS